MPRPADRQLRPHRRQRWRHALYVTIFLHDTRAGRSFDIGLMMLIVASVAVAMADSVPWLHAAHGSFFYGLEWAFTIAFTIEYALRLLCVRRPLAYATSFFGVIDLLTILPTYLSLLLPGTQSLIVIRALRLLRVFRVLRLPLFLTEAHFLAEAMVNARRKIIVFLTAVVMIVVIVGTAMYLIEGPANGFESIPTSVYWAIVTLTTVGYGDVAPKTTMGRFLAGALMIVGYGIIAVPAGVVTSEMIALKRGGDGSDGRSCPRCGLDAHDADARFCKRCGEWLSA
jgi:voltage-gated potassium channel